MRRVRRVSIMVLFSGCVGLTTTAFSLSARLRRRSSAVCALEPDAYEPPAPTSAPIPTPSSGCLMDELTQEELDALPELQIDPNKKLFGNGVADGAQPYSDRYEFVIRGLNGAYGDSATGATDTEDESAGKIVEALTGFPTALTLTVVGKDRGAMLEAVEASFAGRGGTFEIEAERARQGGRFLSLTLSYVAESAVMVREVESELRQAAAIIMCF
mmetsp:Transcript_18528/g.33555  ORF Transcript_18528/g.33555 Transcript_18528/m.33555 type:complete len:215 (-) Transcript_18528:134-778(-)